MSWQLPGVLVAAVQPLELQWLLPKQHSPAHVANPGQSEGNNSLQAVWGGSWGAWGWWGGRGYTPGNDAENSSPQHC